MTKTEQVEEWIKKINTAEKQYEKYYNLIRETREFYKDNAGSSKTEGRYNIFWSGVETQKPFLTRTDQMRVHVGIVEQNQAYLSHLEQCLKILCLQKQELYLLNK